jgi:PAS domain S-box-containing protein
VSPAVEHLLGYGSAELLGRGGWEFVHPDDQEVLRTGYLAAFSDGRATFLIRVAAKDGRWEWIEQSATNLLDTSVRGILCNLRVVTDRVLAEGALRSSEMRYRAIVDTASQGIVTSTPDGVVTYANQQLASTLGIPSSEVYARRVYELLGPQAVEAAYQRLLGREKRGDERYEVDYRHPDGGVRRLAIATSPVFETAEHAALLQLVRCQADQGWLWSAAQAKEDIPAAQWTSLLFAPGGLTEARAITRVLYPTL